MSAVNPFVGFPVSQGARYSAPVNSGAGRSVDYEWPGEYSGAASTNCRSRIGVGTGNLVCSQSAVGTVSVSAFNTAGVDCMAMNCNAAASLVSNRFDPQLSVHVRTTKGHYLGPTTDDRSWFRLICNMASVNNYPNNDAGHDFGFSLAQALGTTALVLKDANLGIHVQIQDANTVVLYIRGPNGLITQTVKSAPFDCTLFHSYEFRVSSATLTSEATFQFLIDNVPIQLPAASSSWAAGSNLPPCNFANGIGFRPVVTAFLGLLNGSLLVQRVKLIAAPTLQDCM